MAGARLRRRLARSEKRLLMLSDAHEVRCQHKAGNHSVLVGVVMDLKLPDKFRKVDYLLSEGIGIFTVENPGIG